MKKVLKQPKLTQPAISGYQKEMARDLIAAFRIKNDEVQKMLNKAVREGWTIDQLEKELTAL